MATRNCIESHNLLQIEIAEQKIKNLEYLQGYYDAYSGDWRNKEDENWEEYEQGFIDGENDRDEDEMAGQTWEEWDARCIALFNELEALEVAEPDANKGHVEERLRRAVSHYTAGVP